MATKYKLAIGDTIEFPIHLTIRDAGEDKSFKFRLQARRIEADELRDQVTPGTEAGDKLVTDVLRGLITGWTSQRLVLDEEGQPADFSVEALDAMLSVSGVAPTIYGAYVKTVLVSSGAEGVRKN